MRLLNGPVSERSLLEEFLADAVTTWWAKGVGVAEETQTGGSSKTPARPVGGSIP